MENLCKKQEEEFQDINEIRQQLQTNNEMREFWNALYQGKYAEINNCYFNLNLDNIIIAVFKAMSNALYLITFHLDTNTNNTFYKGQTLIIKFDENGHGIKANNSPVRIKGLPSPDNILLVTKDEEKGLHVNGMELKHNPEYIDEIIKSAKRPMLPFADTFL